MHFTVFTINFKFQAFVCFDLTLKFALSDGSFGKSFSKTRTLNLDSRTNDAE